ncbi:MAG: hypothetical protein RML36_16045 [Anaerolineae bacterium]|nr:hypothetical protein [Anaerolineae bacterium]MDW8100985.1 hypothetical protein [Anaerolineae bacterium]
MAERVIDFRYAPVSRWTCIGRPDDSYKTLVREDGALLYGFDNRWGAAAWRFNRVLEFALLTDQKPIQVHQVTETASIPVVVTTLRYPKATLTLRAFGHQHDGARRTDVVLWTIEAASGVRDFMTGLWITVYEPGYYFAPRSAPQPSQEIFIAPLTERPEFSDLATFLGEGEKSTLPGGRLAFASVPHALALHRAPGFAPMSALATEYALLSEGQRFEGAILVPQNHEQVSDMDLAWAQEALAAERRFWQGFRLQRIALEVPDPDVMDMVRACARNILQAREIKDGLPEFQVGPTCYRGLWVVDGHFLLEAARYLGYVEDADRGIDALLRRVRPDGSIAQMPFHTKETGIALTTLVRQTELSGRWERLRELWPVVRNAVQYIRQLRREAYELDPSAPEHGLMPASFGDGGLGGQRPEYTTTLWTLVGLKEAARAARILGYEADAIAFQSDFEGLMADFQTHARRDMRTLPDGTPYLPMWMPDSGDHHHIPNYKGPLPPWHRLNPGSATWALCHAIYPGEVFSPDDPLVQNLLRLFDQIDDEEGIPAETGWLPYKAVWNYAASFAAHAWLYAGRPDKAVDYLYAFANHAAPTRVWREEQSFRDSHHGQIVGDMPHNWASAEFIRLVRHLLVFERGEDLELLRGLPPEWLVPGRRIYVERTPTRFGPVTLELQWDAQGQAQIIVERDMSWTLQPSAVRLYLPTGIDVGEMTVNDEIVQVVPGGFVALPLVAHILVRFRPIGRR